MINAISFQVFDLNHSQVDCCHVLLDGVGKYQRNPVLRSFDETSKQVVWSGIEWYCVVLYVHGSVWYYML